LLSSLVENPRTLFARRGQQRLRLATRPLEHAVGIPLPLVRALLRLVQRPLGRLHIRGRLHPRALKRRLRLDGRPVDQLAHLFLSLGKRALTGVQARHDLARHLPHTAADEPLADQLQVAIDLARVIAPPDARERPLHHEERA
jgi:hypothetical protein